jgi:pimeloyl-ACP methyl ester carboxylesterase
MKMRIVASLALAFSLLAPTLSNAGSESFEAGALHVEKQGKGERAVILIPGLSSGPWVWRETAPRLARTHTVYLVTLPGFDGRAAQPGVTLETLHGDLRELIDSRKLKRPVLVGHSLGGTLSLGFASEHSTKIAGVVAVDGLPVFPGTENTPDRKAMAEGLRAQFSSQTREQFTAGQLAYMRNIGTLDEAIAQELSTLAARSDIAATAEFAAQVMAADLRPKLASIQVPVVVISPFHAPDFARIGVDEAMKTAYYRGLMNGTAKLDVVSISPARHFVMFDQPEKFAEALDNALASLK